MAKKIAFIYDEDLKRECDRLPVVLNRASIVHDLINSYNVLSPEVIKIVKSYEATEDELKYFHSSSYIEFLRQNNDCKDWESIEETVLLEYGLGYDCYLLEKTYDLVKRIAGGSLTAAKLLANRKCDVAINWFGGWHHAQRNSAEGFCYVNDVVIAIQKLTESFSRVLYLDLDIHHGDGVQNAFEFSKRVLTLSFHKKMPGFYPGTGAVDECGLLKGKYYSLNVPFLEGIGHETFTNVFKVIFPKVLDAYKPAVIVVQCGADALNGDPIGESNLTLETYRLCTEMVLDYKLPSLFLGGGGYNLANTAKLWTYLTSVIAHVDLPLDIPDDSEYFTIYSPTYELSIDLGFQKDHNTAEYVENLIKTIHNYCSYIADDL